jgi:serine/threonine-protein kinase
MIGKTLSRYKILSKLGEGGMGEVYLAEDMDLGREVALKVLAPTMDESPGRLERFRREARAVASLNHPNIVTLFNMEEAEGRRLLVMERVKGTSLDRMISSGGMPLAEVFAYAIPMADALAAAHEKGITHRDLKPANVMITDDGQVKVLDFGLAKLTAEGLDQIPIEDAATAAPTQPAALTGEGTVMGTAPYMSPEQLSGKEVDPRTDIFSFGTLLYEIVTGQRPFKGDSGIELASSILKDTPSSVVEVRADLPRHLGRIIQNCLEKDPERRFQSAKDIRNELEVLRREVDSGKLERSTSGPVSAVTGPQPTAKRPWGLYAAVGAVVVMIALAGLWLQGRTPSVATAPAEAEGPRTVAVLPFANLGADKEVDYLRLAVPDEIATALSRGPGLEIRPFSTTSRLESDGLDPLIVGRDLGVGNVVTGQYFQEGDRLSLTLESIDVVRNTVIWRDSFVVSAQELLSLRQAVADTVEQGLMPILDPGATVVSTSTLPNNEEAYDLYLRSLPMSTDPVPNAEAMALVEQAVELDPSYAPAWNQLTRRYYLHGNLGAAGEDFYNKAVEAARRALQLDPELIEPQVRLIIIAVERGELVAAYEAADRLIAQRPQAGRAHFVRSYVLRYAGALDQAVMDCDMALGLDPNNPFFRSCGVTNFLAGRYDRALHFLELSPGTNFSKDIRAAILMKQGRPQEAAEIFRQTNQYTADALAAHLQGQRLERDAVQRIVDLILALRDSEQLYSGGSILAYSGEHEAGLHLIQEGIERGYCSYPFMDTDPLLAGLRADPELVESYAEARAAGKACHERFLAETGSG